MKLLAFRHKQPRPLTSFEPIIQEAEKKLYRWKYSLRLLGLIIALGSILIVVSRVVKSIPKEKPIITYTICNEQIGMKYRDKTDGKTRILDGYKYCEDIPMQGTGNGYGSCVDT
jgi:hypothetical protein